MACCSVRAGKIGTDCRRRPVACEHASGSAFILSQNDRNGLAQLLHESHAEPELGLHAIGWFVSHTREGVSLTESDLEIYNHFFPWSWQIALVIRPFLTVPPARGSFSVIPKAASRAMRATRNFSSGQSRCAWSGPFIP